MIRAWSGLVASGGLAVASTRGRPRRGLREARLALAAHVGVAIRARFRFGDKLCELMSSPRRR